jgi:hypothetical protein
LGCLILRRLTATRSPTAAEVDQVRRASPGGPLYRADDRLAGGSSWGSRALMVMLVLAGLSAATYFRNPPKVPSGQRHFSPDRQVTSLGFQGLFIWPCAGYPRWGHLFWVAMARVEIIKIVLTAFAISVAMLATLAFVGYSAGLRY